MKTECLGNVPNHVKHNLIRVRNSLFLVQRYVEARVAEMPLHRRCLLCFFEAKTLEYKPDRRGVGVSSIQMRPRN